MNLGISEAFGLEWMIRFACGCWRRIGIDSKTVLNAYHCPDHQEVSKHMDGL